MNKNTYMKIVSVVIPALNEEKFIEPCLKSLTNQTLPRKEYEIIVVDGNSKDKTVQISKKYADRVLVGDYRPVGAARQAGAEMSKGKIIAFTDADTVVPPDWLERAVGEFNKDPKTALIWGRGIFTGFSKIKIIEYLIGDFCPSLFFGVVNALVVKSAWGFNMIVDREKFKDSGGFNKDYYNLLEDMTLSWQMSKLGRVVYVPDLVVKTSSRRFHSITALKPYFLSWYHHWRYGHTNNLKLTLVR